MIFTSIIECKWYFSLFSCFRFYKRKSRVKVNTVILYIYKDLFFNKNCIVNVYKSILVKEVYWLDTRKLLIVMGHQWPNIAQTPITGCIMGVMALSRFHWVFCMANAWINIGVILAGYCFCKEAYIMPILVEHTNPILPHYWNFDWVSNDSWPSRVNSSANDVRITNFIFIPQYSKYFTLFSLILSEMLS